MKTRGPDFLNQTRRTDVQTYDRFFFPLPQSIQINTHKCQPLLQRSVKHTLCINVFARILIVKPTPPSANTRAHKETQQRRSPPLFPPSDCRGHCNSTVGAKFNSKAVIENERLQSMPLARAFIFYVEEPLRRCSRRNE